MITIENFDKLYPQAHYWSTTRTNDFGNTTSMIGRRLDILGNEVIVWWHHGIPELADIANVDCFDHDTYDFVTDRIWEARNANN